MSFKEPPSVNTMNLKRDLAIDYLRSISIIVMIVLHINPYYSNLPFSHWFVNYGQWVVPAFLLCSFAVGSSKHIKNISSYMLYAINRLKRLLIPYYVWLVAYVFLMATVGRQTITFQKVLPSAFFYGGIDFNWMILLFIYATFLFPLIRKSIEKSPAWGVGLVVVGCFISILYLGERSQLWPIYRLAMLPPWIGVIAGLLLMWQWIQRLETRKVALLAGSSLILFLATYVYLSSNSRPTSTFNHKYPPDLFYYTYCLWTTPLAYGAVKLIAKWLQPQTMLARVLTWVSVHSYTIFFVHLCVLYVLHKGFPGNPFSYGMFILLTFITTFGITHLVDTIIPRLLSSRIP